MEGRTYSEYVRSYNTRFARKTEKVIIRHATRRVAEAPEAKDACKKKKIDHSERRIARNLGSGELGDLMVDNNITNLH